MADCVCVVFCPVIEGLSVVVALGCLSFSWRAWATQQRAMLLGQRVVFPHPSSAVGFLGLAEHLLGRRKTLPSCRRQPSCFVNVSSDFLFTDTINTLLLVVGSSSFIPINIVLASNSVQSSFRITFVFYPDHINVWLGDLVPFQPFWLAQFRTLVCVSIAGVQYPPFAFCLSFVYLPAVLIANFYLLFREITQGDCTPWQRPGYVMVRLNTIGIAWFCGDEFYSECHSPLHTNRLTLW